MNNKNIFKYFLKFLTVFITLFVIVSAYIDVEFCSPILATRAQEIGESDQDYMIAITRTYPVVCKYSIFKYIRDNR